MWCACGQSERTTSCKGRIPWQKEITQPGGRNYLCKCDLAGYEMEICVRVMPRAFFLERLCPRNSGVFFSQIFCVPEIPWLNSNPLRERLFRWVAMPELLLCGPPLYGGGRILRRTLSVCLSVCPSVRPSRYRCHSNIGHVFSSTLRTCGIFCFVYMSRPHIVRRSQPHKLVVPSKGLFWCLNKISVSEFTTDYTPLTISRRPTFGWFGT